MSTNTYSSGFELGIQTKPQSRNLFKRLLDRLVEARMRQAEEYIRQNRHMIPREFAERANRQINERNEDSLPFIR
jgi:hypothetical protein